MKKLSLFLLLFIVHCLSLIVRCNAQSDTVSASVGKNINVYEVDTGGNVNIQSEEHISIDKNNPNNLIIAANTWDFSVNLFEKSQGYYYSHDGGNTWSGGDYFPNSPVTTYTLGPTPYYTTSVGGDPSTAIDANGNIYMASMTAAIPSFSEGYLLNISHDHGVTWTLKTPLYDNYDSGVDKEMIAVDDNPGSPYANNVYCSWLNAIGQIMFNTYIPASDSFTTPYKLYPPVWDSADNGANIQIGPNGEVFECWSAIYGLAGTTYGFYFTENTKGGAVGYWTTPYIAERFEGIAANGNAFAENDFAYTRVNSYPSMGIDRSCGPHRGRVYVTFAARLPSNNDFVIEVTYLDPPYADTGANVWKTPVVVSSPSANNQAFFPWLAVDDITGAVCVDYYKTNNISWATNTYMAYSMDGGSTYYTAKVTDTAHTLAAIPQYGSDYYEGDYIGLTAHNGIAYPTWMDSRNGTPQVFMAKVTIGPYKINTPTTFSSNDSLQTDIEVTPGDTLTIPGGVVVKMGAGHKIIVDSNAVLDVSGTITEYAACDSNNLWGGIVVNGDAHQDQTGVHQGTVILNPGSTIEYAVTGISANSGIISANGATFYNNQNDVQISNYTRPSPFSRVNKCRFSNCTFKTDTNFLPYGYPNVMVTLVNIHGIDFSGNWFEDSIPVSTLSNANVRGWGIYCWDASCNIGTCTNVCLSGCCGAPNTFKGLQMGIFSTDPNPSNVVSVVGNSFVNNYYDIDIENINNEAITGNSFEKNASAGTVGSSYPYNIYLDGCTGYHVGNNTFSNSYYSTSYGIIVNNSGVLNNLVNDNTFNGIYVQTQAQGTNGGFELGFVNSYLSYIYCGLQFQCNQYTSSIANGADISVASGRIDLNQGSSVNGSTTANNEFSYSCGSVPRSNLYMYGTYGINYFWAGSSSSDNPDCISGTVVTDSCAGLTANCSPPPYIINVTNGNELIAQAVNYHTVIRSEKVSLLHTYDSLAGILERGNTPGLFSVIASGTATVIEDSLLAASPYLSDSVLKTAIRKTTIPIETLANILIPNTPLDSGVVSVLDGIGLPDTLVARLNEYQSSSVLSPRSILIAGIDYFQSMIDYADNSLITALETDTTIANSFDSAQAVLESDPVTLPGLAQLASLQWSAGETSTVLVTLDTLKKYDVDSTYADYRKLLPVLMTLNSASSGYLSLIGNSTDSILIAQIAMDTLTPGYANARAVLEYVYNQSFAEPIIPLSSSHRPSRQNTSLLITTDATNSAPVAEASFFKLFPDPANNELNIQYNMGNNSINAHVELLDEIGNKIATWPLLSSQTMVTENIANLSPGFYLYNVFVNNKVVQRGKLVIAR